MYGRPGACYVDIAGDMVNAKVDRSKVRSAVIFSSFSMFFFLLHCITFVILDVFPHADLCPAVLLHQ